MRAVALAKLGTLATAAFLFGASAHAADRGGGSPLERVAGEAIRPIMAAYDVPGMAVAVTVQGKHYFFNYGVASKEGGQNVSESTLFEIGSISKTFTATLASCAQARGILSFSDHASKYFPDLAGSSFDEISLLDLATYTAGGLPLQVPDTVTNQQETLRRAILATHIGYYRLGDMTQGLGWEIYAYPTPLDVLLAGNSSGVILQPNKVTSLVPPAPPEDNVLLDKSGTTNGFGAYVVFVPARSIRHRDIGEQELSHPGAREGRIPDIDGTGRRAGLGDHPLRAPLPAAKADGEVKRS